MNLLDMSEEELKNALKQGKLTVSVYGMGYVGLSLAAVWLRAGAPVLGMDIDEAKIQQIEEVIASFPDEVVAETLTHFLLEGLFRATSNGVYASKLSQIKLIAVPIPLVNGSPFFSHLERAVIDIGRGLKKGDVVIVGSSVPPFTTVNFIQPLLEKTSGLIVDKDFGLAYSPERFFVGRAIQDIEQNYPKIVSGVGPKSTKLVKSLYEAIAMKGVIVMSEPAAAEMEKLLEGVYRDVNIALANELAKFTSALGLDFSEIRDAANSQPYCNLHKPGSGVGGECLPVYPHYLMSIARSVGINLSLVRTAREINLKMPNYVSSSIIEAANKLGVELANVKIAFLGLAFRNNINDTRLSPTYDVINHLRESGCSNFIVHDPYVKEDKKLQELGIPLLSKLNLRGANVIVILTDHPQYKGMTLSELKMLSGEPKLAVIDARNLISNWRETTANVIYVSVGRPWSGSIL